MQTQTTASVPDFDPTLDRELLEKMRGWREGNTPEQIATARNFTLELDAVAEDGRPGWISFGTPHYARVIVVGADRDSADFEGWFFAGWASLELTRAGVHPSAHARFRAAALSTMLRNVDES